MYIESKFNIKNRFNIKKVDLMYIESKFNTIYIKKSYKNIKRL